MHLLGATATAGQETDGASRDNLGNGVGPKPVHVSNGFVIGLRTESRMHLKRTMSSGMRGQCPLLLQTLVVRGPTTETMTVMLSTSLYGEGCGHGPLGA